MGSQDMPNAPKTPPEGTAPPRIVHVQGDERGGLILHTNRLTRVDELVPLIFPNSGGNIPEGASFDHVGGSFVRFRLVVPQNVLHLLDETLRRLYLLPPSYGTRAEAELALNRDLRLKEESAKWWVTYHPVLGMSPRQRLANPGWWKHKGYFVWAGADPHDGHSSVQYERLSQYDSVNDQVEYYLNRGLSLIDATRASIAMDKAQLLAATRIAAGAPNAMQVLERQMMADDEQLHRTLTNELNADIAAIESALRELPAEG